MSFPGFHPDSLLALQLKVSLLCAKNDAKHESEHTVNPCNLLMVGVMIGFLFRYELSLTQTIEHWYPLSWSARKPTNI